MKCKECKKSITTAIYWGQDTQSEYEYEVGHKEECTFFEVGADEISRDARALFASLPIPEIKSEPLTKEELAQLKYEKNLEERGYING